MKRILCRFFGHQWTGFSISVEDMMKSGGQMFDSNTCGRCGKIR